MKPYRELWWPRFWPFLRVVDELPATKRGRRKASNYGVSIVISRDVLRDEPWVLQQEIYESRYWLRHPWRLVDFYWFFGYDGEVHEEWWRHTNYGKYRQAAAHLARVEAASRAQEIRARVNPLRSIVTQDPKQQDTIEDMSRVSAASYARMYARSIHGAKNYPFFAAAGWDEEDCYNEIIKHL